MSNSVEKLIGARIARIRKEREITQEQLAELVDVATETISRLERGVYTVPKDLGEDELCPPYLP